MNQTANDTAAEERSAELYKVSIRSWMAKNLSQCEMELLKSLFAGKMSDLALYKNVPEQNAIILRRS